MHFVRLFLWLILHQISIQRPAEQSNGKKLKDAIDAYEQFFGTGLPDTLTSDTVVKILRPRCGQPDSVQSTKSNKRWHRHHLTYKLVDNLPGFTRNDSIMILKGAINAWLRNVNLIIEEIGNPDERADIEIYSEYIDGPGYRLGYAYLPAVGSIHIDKEETWTLHPEENSFDNVDINWVVIHELGHSLGLQHSNDQNSVMHPYYSPMGISQVTKENVNHLVDLYGAKQMDNDLLCDSNNNRLIDSIFLSYANERIILKNQSFWVFSDHGLEFGPFSIDSYTYYQYRLPHSIDAAFTAGKTTYFFKDDVLYKFTAVTRRFSKKYIIRAFDGLNVKKLDAAFYYSKQRIAFFFKGTSYYMLNFNKPIGQRLEINGDLIKKDWPGIPDDLDAADMITHDSVIFVKKRDYYIFNLIDRTLERGPLDFAKDFLKCR